MVNHLSETIEFVVKLIVTDYFSLNSSTNSEKESIQYLLQKAYPQTYLFFIRCDLTGDKDFLGYPCLGQHDLRGMMLEKTKVVDNKLIKYTYQYHKFSKLKILRFELLIYFSFIHFTLIYSFWAHFFYIQYSKFSPS